MFDTSKISVSPKARIKTLKLPQEASEDLAYFCGLMAGDGHVAVRAHKADYYIELAGNPADEKGLYIEVVVPLMKRLFNLDVIPRMFQEKTYGICVRSKAFVEYLVNLLGLPKNRKYNQLRIPVWVKRDKKLVTNYIRGLADTDFCLSLKRRYCKIQYYPVISLNSKSKRFVEEIAKELESFGFVLSRNYDYDYPDARLKKGWYRHHQIMIYGHMQLVKWMKTIGFSSPKHLHKFRLWQERNSTSKRTKVLFAVEESKKAGALESPL